MRKSVRPTVKLGLVDTVIFFMIIINCYNVCNTNNDQMMPNLNVTFHSCRIECQNAVFVIIGLFY